MYREANVRCVRCGTEMERVETGHGTPLSLCAECGGAWMEVAAFLAELRRLQPGLRVDELMEHNDGTARRPCPVCGESMAIAWLEFLQLDQCEPHGVWLDDGELERAWAGDLTPPQIKAALEEAARKLAARRRKKLPT